MNKYRAKKTTVDGITFDSKAEANRYLELIALQNLGVISNLKLQVPYKLTMGGRWNDGRRFGPVIYKADFVYILDGDVVVEDVKGFKTDAYIIKKKLMKEKWGIEIQEVKR